MAARNSASPKRKNTRRVFWLRSTDPNAATASSTISQTLAKSGGPIEVIVLNVQPLSESFRLRGYGSFKQDEVRDRLINDLGKPIVDGVERRSAKGGDQRHRAGRNRRSGRDDPALRHRRPMRPDRCRPSPSRDPCGNGSPDMPGSLSGRLQAMSPNWPMCRWSSRNAARVEPNRASSLTQPKTRHQGRRIMGWFTADVHTMDDLFLHTPAGHLLCREPDREIAARHDRQGLGRRAEKGLPDASQADPRPDQAARPGLQEAETGPARARNARRSTASSMRRTRSPATCPTRWCSTPP